jgi:hypothetical protein
LDVGIEWRAIEDSKVCIQLELQKQTSLGSKSREGAVFAVMKVAICWIFVFPIKTVAINVAFFAGYAFCIQKIESHIPTLGWVTNTVVDSHGRLGFIYHIMVYLDAKEMQTKTCPAGISVLSPAFSRTVWRIEQR